MTSQRVIMAPMADATVEWGEDRPARWFDRFLGPKDETGRRRFSAPAVGCGIVAIALMVTAEVLPWAVADADQGPFAGNGQELLLGDVGGFLLVGYYPGWMVMLALIGVALVVEPWRRRVIVAGGVGWAAGLMVVTVGVARQASLGGAFNAQSNLDASLGPGVFFGFAGVLVAAAALLLTGWQPGGGRVRKRDDQEPDVDPGPPDLTVTSLD
jgi:hypothetical protein